MTCVKTGVMGSTSHAVKGYHVDAVSLAKSEATFWHDIDCLVVKQSYCGASTGNSGRSCASTKQLYFDKLFLAKLHIPEEYSTFRRRRSQLRITVADVASGTPALMNST